MSKTTTYEILTFKNVNWSIVATHDDKDKALAEARKLYDTDKHSNGIEVFEEKYDDKDNRANTRIIFKKERGSEKSEPKRKRKTKKKLLSQRNHRC